MSERVRPLLPILKRINILGDRAKRQYVKKCNQEFVDCVSECAKNVLRGNVPLKSNQKAKLRRNQKNLRSLAIKRTSLKKRQILQKGAFLAALLPSVLALQGRALTYMIKDAIR